MSSSPNQREPIAVIGIGCRFPGGASSPSKLWDLLSQPRDVLSKIPTARFNPDGFYHPDPSQSGHSNVRHAYVLSEDHRAWDADFFGVSAQEAIAIDPQQRLLMECVYEALEDGGQRMHDLRGSDTAVFVGMMSEEYSAIQTREMGAAPKVSFSRITCLRLYYTDSCSWSLTGNNDSTYPPARRDRLCRIAFPTSSTGAEQV